jgi:hypothetical protein
MFHIVKMATVIAMLTFAAAVVSQARPINFRNNPATCQRAPVQIRIASTTNAAIGRALEQDSDSDS